MLAQSKVLKGLGVEKFMLPVSKLESKNMLDPDSISPKVFCN